MVAFYDNSWNTPTVAVDNIPGLVDIAVGYGDNAAILAFTRYLTPTDSLTPTLQLFTSTWNSTTWSAPIQLTDDALGHRAPQVAYNTLNQPLLTWLAGDELRLSNLTTNDTITLTLPSGMGLDQFRVVQDSAGNLAAVFTAQSNQRDMWVAFYDQALNVWGQPLPLTADRASEAYPAAALDANGQLLMGYASTVIESVTRTTTISGTGEIITFTLPLEGQTDLLTLSHTFTRNVTLEDFAVSDAHPTPGAMVTLSITLHNTQDLAVDDVTVDFYDGDPLASGVLIGSSTFANVLPGGFTTTLSVTYTVPLTGTGRVLYAVADPANAFTESNENDNTSTLAAFGPDLEIVSASAEHWGGGDVGLQTIVRNLGTSPAITTEVTFYQEALTGTLVATNTLPALQPGEAVTLTTPWNFGALGVGAYPLLAQVNANTFTETFIANNVLTFTLEMLPDLMTSTAWHK